MGKPPRIRARRAEPGPSAALCFEGPPKSRWTPRGVWLYRPGIGSGCLLIYPLPDWEELERKLVRLPSMNNVARNIVRIMVGYATEVDMDASGRLLLTRELRDFASLDRHAILIGQGHKFELWDEDIWNEKRDAWLAAETEGELPPDLESLSF